MGSRGPTLRRQTKIGEVNLRTVLRTEDIFRLDIAMVHAVLVTECDGVDEL